MYSHGVLLPSSGTCIFRRKTNNLSGVSCQVKGPQAALQRRLRALQYARASAFGSTPMSLQEKAAQYNRDMEK